MKKILSMNYLVFLFSIFIMRAGWFITLPYISIYLYKNAHVNPIIIGVILGMGALASSIGGFIGGVTADKFGTKRVMLSSIFISALIFALFYIGYSAVFYSLLTFLLGFFRAFFEISASSYITDIIDPAERPSAFGYRYMAINLGGVIGPLIGQGLALYIPKMMFVVTALIYLLTTILFSFTIKNSHKKHTENINYLVNFKMATQVLRADKAAVYMMFIGIIMFIGYSQVDTTLPQYISHKIINYVHVYTALLIVNAVSVVIFQPIANKVFERVALLKLGYWVTILFAISYFGFAISSSSTGLTIFILILSAAEVINNTLTNVIIDIISEPHLKGAYFGAANFAMMGAFIGPILGGVILKYMGGFALYSIFALLTCSCYYLFNLCNKASKEKGIVWQDVYKPRLQN